MRGRRFIFFLYGCSPAHFSFFSFCSSPFFLSYPLLSAVSKRAYPRVCVCIVYIVLGMRERETERDGHVCRCQFMNSLYRRLWQFPARRRRGRFVRFGFCKKIFQDASYQYPSIYACLAVDISFFFSFLFFLPQRLWMMMGLG